MPVRCVFGAWRWALLASGLCLSLACAGNGPKVHGDGGAIDGDLHDGASEHATPPLPDATSDPSGEGGQDARDVSPDFVAMDALEEAPPDGPVPCAVYCNHLPHVLPGTSVGCDANGVCELPNPVPCEDGFAHCSTNPNDGCETDLLSQNTCGSCDAVCTASDGYPVCTRLHGIYYCSPVCAAPTPDACEVTCVDLQTDLGNCGSCGNSCLGTHAVMACTQGQCAFVQCDTPDFAHCPGDTTCETPLGTDANCEGCGDKACALANTVLTCPSANACTSAICAPGYGNCDSSTPDCEASFASGATCLPGHLGTAVFALPPVSAETVAVATDGSYFVAGSFSGSADFDPTPGQDIRTSDTPSVGNGFITKLNADGSYAWTRTFSSGANVISSLAAAAGGAVVATGRYVGAVDLDPGTGVDLHQMAAGSLGDAFVVKLDAAGSFVWGGTFAGTGVNSQVDARQVAVDGTDTVYVAGGFTSTVDFDPGPGTATSTGSQPIGTGMVVKLTAAGAFAWVQVVYNGPCFSVLDSVAVGTDGAVWSVGSPDTTSSCPLGPASAMGSALIVSYTGSGAARGMWFFGSGTASPSSVAAGLDGSVYIGGLASGMADFDPGPGEAKRLSLPGGGFILKLGSDAGFGWVQTLPDVSIYSVAGTSDGGVLASGTGAFLTKLNSDGTSGWTFVSGGSRTVPRAVSAGAASFALVGFNQDGSSDFDPGAGLDIVSGTFAYLSRFSF
jgi:hypothetical protein